MEEIMRTSLKYITAALKVPRGKNISIPHLNITHTNLPRTGLTKKSIDTITKGIRSNMHMEVCNLLDIAEYDKLYFFLLAWERISI